MQAPTKPWMRTGKYNWNNHALMVCIAVCVCARKRFNQGLRYPHAVKSNDCNHLCGCMLALCSVYDLDLKWSRCCATFRWIELTVAIFIHTDNGRVVCTLIYRWPVTSRIAIFQWLEWPGHFYSNLGYWVCFPSWWMWAWLVRENKGKKKKNE